MARGRAILDRLPSYHLRIVDGISFLDSGALLRIGVCTFTSAHGTDLTRPNLSWAIFHVVGANPAMKSESLVRFVHALTYTSQRCTNSTRS